MRLAEQQGWLDGIDDEVHVVPHGDRSRVPIEPYLTDQWFCDAKTLAGPAIQAVQDGTTGFVPPNWTRTYFNWMENIEPWCISRQLWWGHQVPVWYGDYPLDDFEPLVRMTPTRSEPRHSQTSIVQLSRELSAAWSNQPQPAFCAADKADLLAVASDFYGPDCELRLLAPDDEADPSSLAWKHSIRFEVTTEALGRVSFRSGEVC